ncbi:peptidoglycan DD-metalloendopeptidase family protein [Rhodobacteraceae bacterium N5(2021)]|uniref:Peptidoglycan DD-metalloendopeptidase family protein n=1 Tax=Gymnodinialimonas phycosphaerae TaxID=2841589 RepID=A0A975TUZ1_9RHOB|nr:peptidoglycan DD-metalloendopeptidase family protein [Gymnodinialimonas phycosphaerae]MBY4895112.1 peptidoglycan DD-metalloendopeptidase family protein [Gymnodinialimonas phycosphaerae]
MRLITQYFPARRLTLLAPLVLAACVGSPSEWDFDFRPNAPRGNVTVADRPDPDSRGLISYDSYQVAVARRGDTVADVATRIGLPASELATFNGRAEADEMRMGEVLALPRRVDGATPATGGGRDITSIAGAAIDAANGANPTTTGPQLPDGQEPVRHRISRGETAYSVARLYGVSVRSLAEWNGLGPDLAVREGQYLLIPIVIETAEAADDSRPGDSVAPLPPSAANPLPAGIETAALPDLEGAGTGTPAPAPAAAAPTPARSSAPLIRPVSGSVLRGYGSGNEGIDIGAAAGTPVVAAADGTVAAITQDTDEVPILVIRHSGGLLTVYANIQNIAVSRGDRISQGQTVAQVGGGDPSFLHFEVRRGFEAVNPADFLP